MNRIKNFIAISAFTLMVLALPSVASAQWGGNNGGYNPNGGYNRNSQYGVNLERVANDLKDRSRDFEKQVDREFGRNRGVFGGGWDNRGYGNDNIKRLAKDFRKAANEFEKRHDDRGRDSYRGEEAARRMLDLGGQLERAVFNMGRYSNLQYQWNAIRRDLNVVSNAYGYYNRGRNNQGYPNGGNRNTDWRNRFPFPF